MPRSGLTAFAGTAWWDAISVLRVCVVGVRLGIHRAGRRRASG
jgi:hypothetical protein